VRLRQAVVIPKHNLVNEIVMKIRWKNTLVNPQTDSLWMKFTCKYPVLFLIPSTAMFCLGYYFGRIITEMENGLRDSIWLGKLKIMYDVFGKWGIVGFFVFLAFCSLYLFWIYAVSEPRTRI
jgi:hypothetical protein